jgi:hypothetical protein
VARPVELGGLGVFGHVHSCYALRLRWARQARTSLDKPWAFLTRKLELVVQTMFDASVTVQVGNGFCASFLQDRWLDGASMDPLALMWWPQCPRGSVLADVLSRPFRATNGLGTSPPLYR